VPFQLSEVHEIALLKPNVLRVSVECGRAEIQEGWNGTKSARAPSSDLVAGGAFCRADVRVCRIEMTASLAPRANAISFRPR
jgi:hypothetical protein